MRIVLTCDVSRFVSALKQSDTHRWEDFRSIVNGRIAKERALGKHECVSDHFLILFEYDGSQTLVTFVAFTRSAAIDLATRDATSSDIYLGTKSKVPGSEYAQSNLHSYDDILNSYSHLTKARLARRALRLSLFDGGKKTLPLSRRPSSIWKPGNVWIFFNKT